MTKKILLFACLLLCMTACNSNKSNTSDSKSETDNSSLKYARLFTISDNDNYKTISVKDPWNEGNILARYYLVKDSATEVPQDGAKVKIPIQRIALNSCSHAGFVAALGETDKVVGMASSKYVYNTTLQQRLADGSCKDIGDSFAMNFESIAMLNADALMITKYDNSDNSILRVQDLGTAVLQNVEWMEPDILGRAEWIKFVAAFFDKDQTADSIFDAVVANFNALEKRAKNVTEHPSILPGLPYKGTWYVPSGNSYMGRLFESAGGDYRYKNDKSAGSLPLSFETVLSEFSSADIWVGTDAATLDEIKLRDERLTFFEAYKNKKVYNQNKRSTSSGSNDFWETGVVRPDLLLRDLMIILHPEIMPGEQTYFMEQLK